MQLSPKEIQKSTEERVRGQSETSLQMSRQENPLAFARLRLRFRPRQPPRPSRDEAVGDEVLHILRRHGRLHEIALHPSGRHGSPCAQGFLPLHRLLWCHGCSSGRIRSGRRGGGTEEAREMGGKWAHCCKFSLPARLLSPPTRVADAWGRRIPVRPTNGGGAIRGDKVGAKIKEPLS